MFCWFTIRWDCRVEGPKCLANYSARLYKGPPRGTTISRKSVPFLWMFDSPCMKVLSNRIPYFWYRITISHACHLVSVWEDNFLLETSCAWMWRICKKMRVVLLITKSSIVKKNVALTDRSRTCQQWAADLIQGYSSSTAKCAGIGHRTRHATMFWWAFWRRLQIHPEVRQLQSCGWTSTETR